LLGGGDGGAATRKRPAPAYPLAKPLDGPLTLTLVPLTSCPARLPRPKRAEIYRLHRNAQALLREKDANPPRIGRAAAVVEFHGVSLFRLLQTNGSPADRPGAIDHASRAGVKLPKGGGAVP